MLIAGAGDGGRLVAARDRAQPRLGLRPVGFVDDDPGKRRLRIDGVRVRGNTEGDLPRILDDAEPDEVIIAIPSAPGSTRARIVRECRERGIPVRTLPTVFELLQTRGALARQMREVRVEDVLGREPVQHGARARRRLPRRRDRARDRRRRLDRLGAVPPDRAREPHRIVLLDHAEDNLFSIQRELEDERHVPPSMLAAVLADCKEEERMREVFAEHRPTIVFHAAAYKHVGLMEANPVEAVRNNAIATRVVAHVAGELGAQRFVLVSTDKAVAPGDRHGRLQGARRVRARGRRRPRFPQTRYAAVRFGNVLGSSGSVVPIFRRQIERGGPVTVTDERMTRYFMTIPEAVQLIIRSAPATAASALASPRGGEVRRFVLDMGEPVRIVDLARAMIELSGLDPDRDIDDRDRRPAPGGEAARGAVQQLRAPAPTSAEKILLAEREPLAPRRSSRCSPRSACSCSRATRRAWRRRSRSCRPRAGAGSHRPRATQATFDPSTGLSS